MPQQPLGSGWADGLSRSPLVGQTVGLTCPRKRQWEAENLTRSYWWAGMFWISSDLSQIIFQSHRNRRTSPQKSLSCYWIKCCANIGCWMKFLLGITLHRELGMICTKPRRNPPFLWRANPHLQPYGSPVEDGSSTWGKSCSSAPAWVSFVGKIAL